MHTVNQQTKREKSRGAAILIIVLLFTLGSLIVTIGVGRGAYLDIVNTRSLLESRQSYYAAESGVEDAIYRHLEGMSIGTSEVLSVGSATATTMISTVLSTKEITSSGRGDKAVRKMKIILRIGAGTSFNFGLQSNTGGIDMQNTSSVIGNVYSNGPVTGANSNVTYGDVVSAGPSGLISGIHATGSAYARTITNSDIDKDAYYQSISSTVVGGVSYPGSADQATSSLPIPDSMIDTWKTSAEAGGVISSPCPYSIDTTVSIGPKKITCDVKISGTGATITLNGPLWVTGNIEFENGQTVKVSSGLGNQSVPIIADNTSNRTTSSKITIENSTVFQGSGSTGSYVMLVSQNNSSENSGSEVAIDMKNSATGAVLLYAAHGLIELQNNISLKEVTSHKIRLKNAAQVRYETGLANLIFTGGPGGSYVIESWNEVK